jgi:hypothetical protein
MSGPLGDHSLDLPFEAGPPGQHINGADLLDHFRAGGLVVVAAVFNVAGVGPMPCLVYRFVKPTGGFYPPMILVVDDDQMAKLASLTVNATGAAIDAAKLAR